MRFLLLLPLFFSILVPAVSAAQTPDPLLLQSLQTWVNNGAEAGLRSLYADRPELAMEMRDSIAPVAKGLGNVLDTEVVAIQTVSKRVVRYYVAVYYSRSPLWLRIEKYTSDRSSFFLPLRFSIDPDRILPGYITEFQL
jgi:hypothetical protein